MSVRYAPLLQALEAAGCVVNDGNAFFDTITVDTAPLGLTSTAVVNAARDTGINIRRVGNHKVVIAFDETADEADLVALLGAFGLPSTAERAFLCGLCVCAVCIVCVCFVSAVRFVCVCLFVCLFVLLLHSTR